MASEDWKNFKIRCQGVVLLTVGITGLAFITKLPVLFAFSYGMALLVGIIGLWLFWESFR